MDHKKAKPELNAEQRAAVYCEKNAVVAAGAGSGKTSVLAGRFARLITEKGYPVEKILTLTFTRKAAAQMYQRIYRTLEEAAAVPGGPGERARKAIDDFSHARIQTLDSYGASIVKQAAARYGISPDFLLDEDRCRAIAAEEALPFIISRRHHPALEKLYRGKKPIDIAQDLFAETVLKYSAIDDPPDFRRDAEKQFALITAEWAKTAGGIQSGIEALAEFMYDYNREDKFLSRYIPLIKQYTGGEIVFPSEADIRDYFSLLLSLDSAECVRRADGHPVRAGVMKSLVLVNGIYSAGLTRVKAEVEPAKELVKGIRALFLEFSSIAVFCIQAGVILSLMTLLNEFQGLFLAKKRGEGVLTFADVARLALAILREHPDIREGEKKSFEAIMIDEFQDNNEMQKDLLFLLAEKTGLSGPGVPSPEALSPEKLFFVGDEKQSIYRFRGADVAVFRCLKDSLSGTDLSLSVNYRSAPALIGAFNALFGGSEFDPSGKKPLAQGRSVFIPEPPGASPLPLFEASYKSLSAGSTRAGKPPALCILEKQARAGSASGDDAEPGEDDLFGADENEAIFTAGRIKELLDENQYRPGDIAILFRSHGPQRLFEKHLRLRNIPYASDGISGFFSDGPVNDMVSVLRLAAYPMDTEAYGVMLRSPFVGLSIQGLTACLAAYNQEADAAPFSEAAAGFLAAGDREKFFRGRELYQRTGDLMSRNTLCAMVSGLWYAEGYRYETEWNPRTAVYRELYDYLFSLAAKADAEGLSLAAFTDRLQSLRERGGRLEDMDIPLERPGAVRLMTIHKSKGLEFPVVFICCCGSKGRNSGNDADVYRTAKDGMSLNPPLPPECSGMEIRRNFFYEQCRLGEKQKKTAELRRLLYVAMTRAEQELYLTGSLSFKKDNPDTGNPYLRLRRAMQDKRAYQDEKDSANGISRINDDSVIDNDTLFGLLLPAVADRITEDGSLTEDAPSIFRLETIPAYTAEEIRGREKSGVQYFNDRSGLAGFFEAAAPFYDRMTADSMMVTPEIRNNHRAPTSFREEAAGAAGGMPALPWVLAEDYSGDGAGDVFSAVDEILRRFAPPDEGAEPEGDFFTPADFGTIAHACVEALMNGGEALIPPNLGGHLSPAEADALLAGGKELAKRFVQSPLGRAAQSASLRKSEYRFRSLCGTVFINGTIDLLFEDEKAVWVVDFKTDGRENPAEHAPQMSFYYRAAMDLLGKPHKKECRLFLYYLRTGHGVELTKAAAQLEKIFPL
jgi:ATP-dependent helicase/nuclease subunit A